MKLDKATVTIHYEEFEKHQEEIDNLRESLLKAEENIKDLSKTSYALFSYMNHLMKAQHSMQATMSIYEFAEQKGLTVKQDRDMNYLFVTKDEAKS